MEATDGVNRVVAYVAVGAAAMDIAMTRSAWVPSHDGMKRLEDQAEPR